MNVKFRGLMFSENNKKKLKIIKDGNMYERRIKQRVCVVWKTRVYIRY